MATIKDVARVAETSIATVSAVLNGTAKVSDKLSKRIWAAIESTGYSPDGVARSLRRGRTRSIGVIVGDISNPFFTSLIKAVEARATNSGHSVIIANSDDDPDKEMSLLKILREQRVAGILLAPSGHDAAYLEALARMTDVPVVLVDRHLPDSKFDAMLVDNFAAGRIATDYLIRLNHQRIAIIGGNPHFWTAHERLRGYRESLVASGLDVEPELEVLTVSQVETAYGAVQKLLTLPKPPSAIFATSNMMMLGAIEAIMDMGFRCPDDISLVGIDDFPWGSAIRPKLTTVAQPIAELGARAAEMLIDRIAGKPGEGATTPPSVVMLEPRLVIRDSCARLEGPGRAIP